MRAEDRDQLETWLASSDAHRRAYEQTGAMWGNFEASADEGELRALRVAALATAPPPKVWFRAAAIAAGLFGIAALGALAWHWSEREQPSEAVTLSLKTPYVTARNQRSTVTLPDGTLVSMNLDTSMETDFSGDRRFIHLSKGQAFFEVAKDQRRPFIVSAADRTIRALGTQFDVRLDSNRVEVVLLEGRVSVDRTHPALLEKLMKRSTRVELRPGQRLVAAAGEAPAVTTTNAAHATSWREGWIIFEDQTVERAVSELNRYSDRPIVVADDAVNHMRFSGVFKIGQPDRFGAVIQELLPLSAQQGAAGETVLVAKPRVAP
jgi:transmembrane sensor